MWNMAHRVYNSSLEITVQGKKMRSRYWRTRKYFPLFFLLRLKPVVALCGPSTDTPPFYHKQGISINKSKHNQCHEDFYSILMLLNKMEMTNLKISPFFILEASNFVYKLETEKTGTVNYIEENTLLLRI